MFIGTRRRWSRARTIVAVLLFLTGFVFASMAILFVDTNSFRITPIRGFKAGYRPGSAKNRGRSSSEAIVLRVDALLKGSPAQIKYKDEVMIEATDMDTTRLPPSPSDRQGESCRSETHHIAFAKVHKAGSTTVMNIFQRFAYDRELLIALPQIANSINKDFSNLVKIPGNRKFDMLINHVPFYTNERFAQILPKDSKYVGIVRDPFELTVSAFEYYSRFYGLYRNVPQPKLLTYLKNRQKYEPRNAGKSFTNNRMSYDFGLPQKYFHDTNRIEHFIRKLDTEMDFVMVLENFTESLVLLKRKFCWELKDILFITRNKNDKKTSPNITTEELAYHRNFSLADNMLYDFFTGRFNDHVAAAGDNFRKEVTHFERLIQSVSSHCLAIQEGRGNALYAIEKTDFNQEFNVTSHDCRLMLYNELKFCDISRARQEHILSQ